MMGRPSGGPGHGPGMFGRPVGMPTEKARDPRATIRRLLELLRPDRALLVVVALLSLTSVGFSVAGPRLLGKGTDLVVSGLMGAQLGRTLPPGSTKADAIAFLQANGQARMADLIAGMDLVPGRGLDTGALQRAMLLVLAVYLFASLFAWGQAYLMAGVTQRAVFQLREQVDHKLGRLPLVYFDTHARGDVLSRVTNDIDNVSTTLQQSLTQLITSTATVLGVLVLMFVISPLLAVVSLISVPASFALIMVIAKRAQPQFAAQWKWTGTLNGHIEETFTGHELVRLYGRRHQAMATFEASNDELYRSSFKAQFVSGLTMPAMMVISNLAYVAIAVLGGLRVASGTMSIGDVQAFIQYSRQFSMPIGQLASIANVVQSGIASAERVFELLDEPEESPDPASSQTPAALAATAAQGRRRGRVEVDDISFRYRQDTPLIDNLTFEAAPGQTVAIVGPTGAGKTTLVNLLMRFYELDGGTIRLDGSDIATLSRDDVRRTFGMVLQDAWLFGGTIRENIRYGNLEATDEQLIEAAKAAHVDHVVRTLSDGYETVLDDEASNLSAGERQLLTIARAFVADPAILILDEATSSVDTRTEVLIQQAMNRLRAGRTSFVIAHRLSTIRTADLILVMDQGAVVERGNHEQLLEADGRYAELIRSQFAEPVVGG
jgi:ATP-binding cassette, subfamily B, multidrug efflux pump